MFVRTVRRKKIVDFGIVPKLIRVLQNRSCSTFHNEKLVHVDPACLMFPEGKFLHYIVGALSVLTHEETVARVQLYRNNGLQVLMNFCLDKYLPVESIDGKKIAVLNLLNLVATHNVS